MRVSDPVYDVAEQPHCFMNGKTSARLGKMVAEGLSVDEGHHVVQEPVRLTGIDQRENVRVLQLRGDRDLTQKPVATNRRGEVGVEDLDRDHAPMTYIRGAIHRRHTAVADLALDRIAASESSGESLEYRHALR